jgi:hypothetical protein
MTARNAIMGRTAMGIFRRKQKPKLKEPKRPSLVALLSAPTPINEAAVAKELEAMEFLRLPVRFELLGDRPVEDQAVDYGMIEFDSHRIRVIGLDAPVPESLLQGTVDVAPLLGDHRESLRNHKAHWILISESGGKNALERCIALLKLASALGGDKLLGVASEEGFTALPGGAVHDLMTRKALADIRESLPPVVFTGSFRLRDKDGDDWMVTRGHHLFGIPDFVMRADAMEGRTIAELFHTILNYAVTSGKELNPGDTMQLDDKLFMRLLPLKPDDEEGAYDPVLRGRERTLEVTLIKPEDINKPRKHK